MNTFIMSQSGGNEGLGFAIPSATVRTAFRQLKQFGQLRRQEIGVSLQTITPDMAAGLGLARDHGVIVSDVWPGSPAEKSGVMIGDILVSVDNQPAENLPTVNYFFRLRESTERVQLVVLRSKAEFLLQVTPIEDRDELGAVSAGPDADKNMVNELGILGVEIDQRIASTARGLRSPTGVIVVARVAGARGEVPLLPRDVIRSVNTRTVTTVQGLREMVRALPAGASVTLQIQRDGRLMYLSFVID
jgi:serine protease Do